MSIFTNKLIADNAARNGYIGWRSPSNIAFVKYWGKKDGQIPANPSVSMTLDRCYTEMMVDYKILENANGPDVSFTFDGRKDDKFALRITKYLNSIIEHLPFLKYLALDISSSNSFPHSAGIASSASSMSALALCLVSLEEKLCNEKNSADVFGQKASFLARLASGSACRSIYGGYTLWGEHKKSSEGSSDLYAVKLGKVHRNFENLCDAILLVDSSPKPVSSSKGHSLMDSHPWALCKYQSAVDNISSITKALESGDWKLFGKVLEQEALGLHAMMMTSDPSVLLLKPNSLSILSEVRKFREKTGIDLYFTIDAGPNIHLLYKQEDAESVGKFINDELICFLENGKWIADIVGTGPQEIY